MAAAAVQNPLSSNGLGLGNPDQFRVDTQSTSAKPERRDVKTVLNYYKAPEDGSPPHPTYVDRPETYDRPTVPLDVTIRDVRGEEDQYTLDKNGFQIYQNVANEKDFLDDEQIKAGYYPETEQLLKDA